MYNGPIIETSRFPPKKKTNQIQLGILRHQDLFTPIRATRAAQESSLASILGL